MAVSGIQDEVMIGILAKANMLKYEMQAFGRGKNWIPGQARDDIDLLTKMPNF